MPTGNHGPCEAVNAPVGALNHSQGSHAGSGAINTPQVQPMGNTTNNLGTHNANQQ